MSKPDNKTYKTQEVVATAIAVLEFHKQLVHKINPAFNYEKDSVKLANVNYITPANPTKFVEYDEIYGDIKEPERVEVAPVTDYVKRTVTGESDTRCRFPEVCEVLVTEEHRELAAKQIEYISQICVIQILQGKEVKGFQKAILEAIRQEDCPKHGIGLLAYVPNSYTGLEASEAVNQSKAAYVGTSTAQGVKGEKIAIALTIMVKRFLKSYDSYVYEGHDENGNLYSFWRGQDKSQWELNETIKITAKIKSAEASEYASGAIVNSINWVKEAK